MKILLAGPGTGKTTKIKSIIKDEFNDVENILVLSFTNATIDDLKDKFKENTKVKCFTLHSYALLINHLVHNHIIDGTYEESILKKFSNNFDIDFKKLCYFLQSITFDGMIESCSEFLKANPAYGAEKIGVLDLLIVDEF